MRKTIAALAVSLVGLSSLCGATLVNNGGLNNLGGNAMGDLLQADDFSLPALSNLTSVTYFSVEAGNAYTGSTQWWIYSNVGGQPGAVVGGGNATPTRTNVGTALGLDAWENTFAINVPNVGPATYWLVLHNGPLASTAFSDFYWGWTGTVSAGNGLERSLDPVSATWDPNGNEHAFSISGDVVRGEVPEPGTVFLLSGGLAVLWLGKRSQTRREGGK